MEFEKVSQEFAIYRRKTKRHFKEFEATKIAWAKLLNKMD